ncbi:GNAT family N-acetyltransferase [Pyxidicoccus parkwayensis]|jgi:GNAT superfamily N-acetyltransferase|uniref:GNAT family N-acetyltransferase n=1 Tax=Pyxidicoccus parkwayensis TaxID=2813578 RepID=A0ABX7P7T1_9BACT|nr:GNAT family N-acetyltransferase [Pyxidicoccus parkwaysis]QSQ26574.1 GNAT family N-acetyltransferase [Pyxidicoccus parkwaysis]
MDARYLAWRIEQAQAEQVDQTPLPGRTGRPSLHVAGGRAIYTGPRALFSIALGVGLDGAVSATDVDRMEALLGQDGGLVRIELSSFADPSLSRELARRRYTVESFQLVWWRQPAEVPPPPPGVTVRPLHAGEERTWAGLFFHAYAGRPVAAEVELLGGLNLTRTPCNTCFFACVDGAPRGVGVVSATEGVALLSGDGVPPPYRGRGLQLALIHARLAWAAERGCDVATASTEPSTASQRSYEKAGFRCAYPKLVMVRPAPGT